MYASNVLLITEIRTWHFMQHCESQVAKCKASERENGAYSPFDIHSQELLLYQCDTGAEMNLATPQYHTASACTHKQFKPHFISESIYNNHHICSLVKGNSCAWWIS